ncbi:hypothetical protein ACJRO0_06220 [Acetobacter oryzifermentans]|uniref:hypothetical protein n=1 Tax=Acetobacter oryzifermentans TaxID=1633874 RepID=UPI0039BEF443
MNSKLHSLYSDFKYELIKNDIKFPGASAPYLLSPTKEYWDSKFKVVVLGQETLGWNWSKQNCSDYPAYGNWPYSDICCYDDFLTHQDSVDALMEGYTRFDNASHQPKNKSRAFWQAFDQIQQDLGCSIISGNVCRISYPDDNGSRYFNAPKELQKIFDPYQEKLLRNELEILCPNAVIMLTSSKYDDFIWNAFPYPELTLNPIENNIAETKLGKFSMPNLPFAIYRTYHPQGLRFTGHWDWIQDICNLIKNESVK